MRDIIQSLLLLLAYMYARYAHSDCTARSQACQQPNKIKREAPIRLV